MNVLILAGAKSGRLGSRDVMADGYRAGLSVGGRTLLEQALSAVAALPGIGRVILVGPAELVPPAYTGLLSTIIPPEGDLLSNLRRGLAELPADEMVLVVASDMPLLTGTALKDFCARSSARQAEIYYPVIRRETYEAAYPGSRRTYLGVRDGTFTGGNVALFQPAVFYRHERLIARAIERRKHPRRLGRLLGWGFFLGLLRRKYTIAEIESRLAKKLGIRAAAIESNFSEMGFDIDTADDLAWIQFYWGGTLEGHPKPDEQEPPE